MRPHARDAYALLIRDSLRAPIDGELRRKIQALVRRGERTIVLDLARVHTIDAAGAGELMLAYRTIVAANGVLRIVHANRWVREILERAGLLRLLSADWNQFGLANVD
jgi:anti-anti-sigma factor